jgi:hypothetical protein
MSFGGGPRQPFQKRTTPGKETRMSNATATSNAQAVLLTVRGRVKPASLEEARTLHNQTAGSPQGMAAARELSDLSHTVYGPARGAGPLSTAAPGELLFIDHWADINGLQSFFGNAHVQEQGGRLFTSRDPSVWMAARGSFSFHVPATAAAPARFVGLLRARVSDVEKAIADFARVVPKNLRNARRRGQLSHELYVRMGAPSEPVEILGLDQWTTLEGLLEHYGDRTGMEGIGAAFAGPPDPSVWEQMTGFNEW